MTATPPSPARYRFGPFELDLDARQLLENCNPVHTPDQSLRLLEVLLRHAGRLVTRQQLQTELWPDGTYVNFERSINSAMRRLRRALGDDGENPRFIATVTGHGYRFIAPVEPAATPEALSAPLPSVPAEPVERASGRASSLRRWLLGAAGLALLWVLSSWVWLALQPTPRVLSTRAITTDGGVDLPGRPASDGTLIYFLERAGGGWNLMRSDGDAAHAESLPSPFPGRSARLLDISPDRSQWLLESFLQRGEEGQLWRQPAAGGAPVRLGDLRALDAVWSPDGLGIYYGSAGGLWRARADGSDPQRLAALPATPDWLTWSPDGTRLRFNGMDPVGHLQALWEWRPGRGVRLLPAALPRCCAAWSPDGRYFLSSEQKDGIWNLWVQRDASWAARLWPWLKIQPNQLTAQPYSSWGAFTEFGADTVVFYQEQWRERVARYQLRTHQLLPLLPGREAIQVVYSPDGQRLAYLDTRSQTVWTADVDANLHGSNFREISPHDVVAAFPRWSPDSQWIVFSGQRGTQPTGIFKVPAAGGPATELMPARLPPGAGLYGPDWSPVADRLVVSISYPSGNGKPAVAMLAHGVLTPIPGSGRFAAAQWSPDGRWLAAFSSDQRQIWLYDVAQGRWQLVAQGNAFTGPIWSRDGYAYFQDLLARGEPLFRYRPGERAPEQLADFSGILSGGVHRCGFTGIAPDGSLILSLNIGTDDLYAATLNLSRSH